MVWEHGINNSPLENGLALLCVLLVLLVLVSIVAIFVLSLIGGWITIAKHYGFRVLQ